MFEFFSDLADLCTNAAPRGKCNHLLAHLSPLGWEHVNLTGDYVWAPADGAEETRDRLRPLSLALHVP